MEKKKILSVQLLVCDREYVCYHWQKETLGSELHHISTIATDQVFFC